MGFPHSVITISILQMTKLGLWERKHLAKVQTHIRFPEPHMLSPQTREESSGFGG